MSVTVKVTSEGVGAVTVRVGGSDRSPVDICKVEVCHKLEIATQVRSAVVGQICKVSELLCGVDEVRIVLCTRTAEVVVINRAVPDVEFALDLGLVGIIGDLGIFGIFGIVGDLGIVGLLSADLVKASECGESVLADHPNVLNVPGESFCEPSRVTERFCGDLGCVKRRLLGAVVTVGYRYTC